MLVLPYRLRLSLRCVLQFTLLTCALSVHARPASADAATDKPSDKRGVVAAASAFTQGQQAELSGNNERAAELFELADRIAPTPEALRSATRARLAAGQLPSAAGNAEELLRRYESDPSSRALAEQVLTRAKPELTRLTFQCSEPCSVVVDGFATGVSPLETQVVYVSPGAHDLVIGFEGDLTRGLHLSASAGEARTVKVPRPAPWVLTAAESQAASAGASANSASQPKPRARLSPVYFWVCAGATVATGAIGIWSGLDLMHARDDFKNNPTPTRSEFNDGESKDRRTSVLIAASSALAVGTAALAVFTDFAGRRRGNTGEQRPRSASVSFDGHGARLTYGKRF